MLAWYSDAWCVHCDDACAYLGPVDPDSFASLTGAQQVAVRRTGCAYLLDGSAPDPHRVPPVHLFACLHCGRFDAVQ
jgi:uncharacterized protein CbrC (UPF0167 family)